LKDSKIKEFRVVSKKMNKLVLTAREWLGTPWMHKQAVKGIGVDCINFLYIVGLNAGLDLKPIPEQYGRIAVGDDITNYLDRHFIKRDDLTVEQGDILLFKFSGYNNHVAIATSSNTMIHASANHKKVVEHAIDGIWIRMLKGVWRVGISG
jgi:cell wall-associated NlpC family hydrolase